VSAMEDALISGGGPGRGAHVIVNGIIDPARRAFSPNDPHLDPEEMAAAGGSRVSPQA